MHPLRKGAEEIVYILKIAIKVKTLLMIFGSLLCAFLCYAQKPPISESDVENWPNLAAGDISNDGRYISYSVLEGRSYYELYVRSVGNDVLIDLGRSGVGAFTEDSRAYLCLNSSDSLCLLDLAAKSLAYISGVKSYQLPKNGGLPLLAYQTTDGNVQMLNRQTGDKQQFDRVEDYSIADGGKVMLVFQRLSADTSAGIGLRWVNLDNGQSSVIWRGKAVSKFVLDAEENKVAFIVNKGENKSPEIWQYDSRKDSVAGPVVGGSTAGMEAEYPLGLYKLEYSPDGQRLFFGVQHKPLGQVKDPRAVQVDVWNYRDEFLQCDQLKSLNGNRYWGFWAVFDPVAKKVIRLDEEKYSEWGEQLNSGDNAGYLLAVTTTNNAESPHTPKELPDVYLVNTHDGTSRCIARQLSNGVVSFSAGGKYVYWYDPAIARYKFYNISKGTIKTATRPKVPGQASVEYIMWLPDDKGVLLGDGYDIWQLDPEVRRPPVNITNGYGRRNHLVFRLVKLNAEEDHMVKLGPSLLLSAFDKRTKNNGFFLQELNASGDPRKLSMEPGIRVFLEEERFLTKAKDADAYMLFRMRSDVFPRLEVTHDFKTFKPLTDLAPEKKVNWLTSELIHWRAFDGRPGEGILYKPEDFDSTKKYPVIFYYYELLSQRLNKFIDPVWSNGTMNIPWFVSRGYVVVCPDIYYSRGDPGKGTYNFVVSAAEMMKTKKWVDPKRMGIQGHSYGGYQTNYLVTKTNLFAAAASAAGATDMISMVGSSGMGSCANYPYILFGQGRMNVPFWENPGAYIRNSAIFGVEKVTTPLLIMHCKKDGAVPFSQGVELFTALRWLRKPAFMLQYDDGGHGLDGAAAVDYTRRLTQFFDHYLKGAPAPKWMTEGVPASLKGIESGLELPAVTVNER
jgi:dienelactone hydrolase